MILIDQMETLRRLLKKQIELQNRHLERTLLYHGLTEAIEEVQKMPVVTVNVNEWISVKDRLPEVPEGYWCVEILVLYQFDDSWHCRVMSYCDGTENVLNRQKGWYPALGDADFLDQFVDHGSGLTHWMYLPKPPKEDNKV